MTDRQLTLMAVHAHPDDEATGTGGILARYAAEGVRTVLVTCTDGGCGDGPGGVKPGEPGHDPEAVVAMRKQELEASAAILKVSDLELLGYADSGMMGWAQNEAPHAFWNTPVAEAAARLGALIEQYQPDVVLTYDPYGFYGHPDHIQAHRITMAAMESTKSEAKLYWTTAPRSKMAEFGAIMKELGMNWDDDEPGDPETNAAAREADPSGPPPEVGLPDDQITTWVDTTAYSDQKFDSLAAHASQSENIFFLKMGRERFSQMMGMETFVRVVDGAIDSSAHEDDLFVGRREAQ